MRSTLRSVRFWICPVAALLVAALASGGLQPWFFYALGGLAVGIVAPWLVSLSMRALLVSA